MLESVGGGVSRERFWRNHIEGWRRSGASQRNYCASRNLALSTFTLWRRRLAEIERDQTDCFELVPVPTLSVHAGACITLVVGAEYRIEVSDGARPETLRVVLEALQAR